MRSATFTAAAVAFLALAGTAVADTIKVPKDQPTIQAGVIAAVPGDKVLVAKGVYYENVVVATRGIRIEGPKEAIVDGTIVGVDGDCLTILAADVVVKGMTFRNGRNQIALIGDRAQILKCTFEGADLHGVYGEGMAGATITNSKFLFTGDEAIDIQGSDNTVSKCTMTGGGSYGVLFSGDGNRVESCTFVGLAENGGVFITGDGAIVSKNTCRNGDVDCFRVDGAGAVVEKNKGERNDGRLVQVNGAGAVVRKNTGKSCRGGILVTGPGAQILSNTLTNTVADAAIEVDGDGFTVQDNTVQVTIDEADGIVARNASPIGGGLIEGNKVTDAGGYGFRLGSEITLVAAMRSVTIRKNTATSCGSGGAGGFLVLGDTNTLDGNKATDSGGPGISLEGDGNTVTSCTVQNSSTDGFSLEIPSVGNTFDDCSATKCGGEGFENGGLDTTLTNSTFTKNRIDIAKDPDANFVGGLATVTFTTGGESTVPEVD